MVNLYFVYYFYNKKYVIDSSAQLILIHSRFEKYWVGVNGLYSLE